MKRTFICAFQCPECGKVIKVFKEVDILVAAQPAEKKERYVAEKDMQTVLMEKAEP